MPKPITRFGLDRNTIKYILIFAMLLDHLADAFVPSMSVTGQIMHIIGRLTGPAMSLLIAEGYQYTKNRKKYALRLFIFALISWPAFSLCFYGKVSPLHLGMIFSLFIAFITIWMWDKLRVPKAVKIIFVVLLCAITIFGDWPFFAVLWAFFAYIFRDRPKAKWISFCSVAAIEAVLAVVMDKVWYSQLYQFGAFLVPLLLVFLYNGKKGSNSNFHKWFFYIFYPGHLFIIWGLKMLFK